MRRLFLAVFFLVALSACGGGVSVAPNPPAPAATPCNCGCPTAGAASADTRSVLCTVGSAGPGGKIKHIVFILQENRTFDGIFGGPNPYPGVDAATSGKRSDGTTVPLQSSIMGYEDDIDNDYGTWLKACDLASPVQFGQPVNCKMDGFDQNKVSSTQPYVYADRTQVAPYWDIARKYVLSDRFFMSHDSESYTAHQYLFSGQSGGTVNAPYYTGARNSLISWNCYQTNERNYLWQPNVLTPGAVPSTTAIGPTTCWNYKSLADLVLAANRQWRVYTPFSYYNVNATASYRSLYSGNGIFNCGVIYCNQTPYIRFDTGQLFTDLQDSRSPYSTLADVTWLLPPVLNSDHPFPAPYAFRIKSGGPQWLQSEINAIGKSANWSSTLIFITWDDWGGFYDHVPPYMARDAAGVGFRVPLMIVSPYSSKPGCVLHTNADFGALLKFAEQTFGLGNLGAGSEDTWAGVGDITGCLNFNQAPQAFTPIGNGLTAVPPIPASVQIAPGVSVAPDQMLIDDGADNPVDGPSTDR